MVYVSFYHFSYKYKAKGYAQSHAEYICREGKYSKLKDGEELISVKSGNMPKWAEKDPIQFFKATDKYERSNAKAYREFEVAISNKLSREDQIKLIDMFVAKELGANHPYLYAIHDKDAAFDSSQRQTHAHIMFSERTLDGIERPASKFFKKGNTKAPHKGGCLKDPIWGKKSKLRALRKSWEKSQNDFFKSRNMADRVDSRSLVDMQKDALVKGDDEKAAGFNRVPVKRIGEKLKQMTTEELINDVEIFEKLEQFTRYRENQKISSEINKIVGQSKIDTQSIMTVSKAKQVLLELEGQNKEQLEKSREYLYAVKYRQNAINRQYKTQSIQNAVYSQFSKEFVENKKALANLSRRERELNKEKAAAGDAVDKELLEKLKDNNFQKQALLKTRELIIAKIDRTIEAHKLEYVKSQIMNKLYLQSSKIELKEQELELRIHILKAEKNDIRIARRQLWDLSKNRIVKLNKFKEEQVHNIGKNKGSSLTQDNYVEMGATGTRLQVKLYDERELER